ncbi:hypothetical protein V6615_16415 (plasmid) [Oscillospiraceae bacterium PP1C4]
MYQTQALALLLGRLLPDMLTQPLPLESGSPAIILLTLGTGMMVKYIRRQKRKLMRMAFLLGIGALIGANGLTIFRVAQGLLLSG